MIIGNTFMISIHKRLFILEIWKALFSIASLSLFSLALFPFSFHVLPLSLFSSVFASTYLSLSLLFHPLPLSLSLLPCLSLILLLCLCISLFVFTPFPASGSLVCTRSPSLALSLYLSFSVSLVAFILRLLCLRMLLNFLLHFPLPIVFLFHTWPTTFPHRPASFQVHAFWFLLHLSVQLIYFLQDYTPCPSFSLYVYTAIFPLTP